MRAVFAAMVVGALAYGCVGSSGDESGGGSCTAGETQVCLCAAGLEGVQVCLEGGNQWGACSCGDGGVTDFGADGRECDPSIPDHCVEICDDCASPGDESSENPFELDPNYESRAEVGGQEGRQEYGSPLGEFRGVTIYSNYKSSCGNDRDCWFGTGNGRSTGVYGYHFQCVEYVVRFYAEALGYENMNGSGNAKYYWSEPGSDAAQRLERYPNGGDVPPQPGDIIVFDSTGVGHVAIIREVSSDSIRIIQQNWFHTSADANHRLAMNVGADGTYQVSNLSAAYPVLGWLRPPGSTLECTLDAQCGAERYCDSGICIDEAPCDPVLNRLDPAGGCPGEQFSLRVFGSCLKEDPLQGVRVHIDDVELTNRELVDSNQVSVTARVLDGARPGARSVSYANSDARRGSWDGLFEVYGEAQCGRACEPVAESCNGQDDDCDNQIDENNPCPAGQACDSGQCVGVCQPSDESCNGQDDDCDGRVDENLSRGCDTECGAGNETCQDGQWRDCNAPQPQNEVCDGQDNDCDGVRDEGSLCGGGMACEDGRCVDDCSDQLVCRSAETRIPRADEHADNPDGLVMQLDVVGVNSCNDIELRASKRDGSSMTPGNYQLRVGSCQHFGAPRGGVRRVNANTNSLQFNAVFDGPVGDEEFCLTKEADVANPNGELTAWWWSNFAIVEKTEECR